RVILEHRARAAPLALADKHSACEPVVGPGWHLEARRHATVCVVFGHRLSGLDACQDLWRRPRDALVVDVDRRAVAGLELVVGLEFHQPAGPEAWPVATGLRHHATVEAR